MDLKNSVLTSLRWTVSAKLIGQIISWISTFLIIRLLQPDDYGLMAMSMILISFFSMINEMGLGQAIVQAQEINQHQLRQCFGLVILVNLVTVLLLCLSSPAAAFYFNEDRLSTFIPVLSIQFLIQIFIIIPSSLLEREMDFRYKSIVEISSSIFGTLATLLMAFLGAGIWSIILGNLLSQILCAFGINIRRPFFLTPSFHFRNIGKIVNYGFMTVLNRLLWFVYSQADVFIVGRLLGKTVLGYYSVGFQLASLPLIKMSAVFNQIGLAAFSRIQNERNLIGYYSIIVARIVSFTMVPIFFGIASIADEVVLLVLGDHWQTSAQAVQFIAFIFPLRSLSLPLAQAINAKGQPRLNVINLFVACLIMPASFIIGAYFWKLQGVCYAWIITYPIWFIYVLNQCLPELGLKVTEYLKEVSPPFIVGLIMFLSIYMIKQMDWSISLYLQLTLLIISGIIIYTTLSFIFLRKHIQNVLSSLKTKNI